MISQSFSSSSSIPCLLRSSTIVRAESYRSRSPLTNKASDETSSRIQVDVNPPLAHTRGTRSGVGGGDSSVGGRDGEVSKQGREIGGWDGVGASGKWLAQETLSSCSSISGPHLASQHAAASPILSDTEP